MSTLHCKKDLTQSVIFALIALFGVCLSECGGRSSAPPVPEVQKVTLGPGGAKEQVRDQQLLEVINDEGLSAFRGTRGLCTKESYQEHTKTARALVRSGDFKGALKRINEARSCVPDEDQLLLIAAIKDKQARLESQEGALSEDICRELLLSWQSYLSSCHRCKSVAVHHMNKAIRRANQLGAQCGAWVSWRSDPLRARIFVEGVEMGVTPATIWLPSGSHKYSARSSDRVYNGTLSLKTGEEIGLNTQLKRIGDTDALPSYQLEAQLSCDRPSSDTPLKRCEGALKAGDKFRVRFNANEDVYLYLMSLNNDEVSVIVPSKRPVLLRRSEVSYLPNEDAYQLDDQGNEDAVVVMTSIKPVSLLLDVPLNPEDKAGWEKEVRSLVEEARSQQGDKRVERSDEQGWVLIKWDLRPPVQIPLKGNDNS